MGRFTMTVAAYLFIESDGKTLLLRRFNTGYEDGNYSLIAGHLDGGETVQQAISREALEEAGLTIKPEDVRIRHVMHRRDANDSNERIDYFCSADAWSGELKNCEPHKCDELSWHDPSALPANTIAYVRAAIEHYQKGVPFSHFGF